MTFLIDALCYLVVPLLIWRVLRGVVPMAVLPILAGLGVAVAADRFGFDKSIVGPSQLGETIGWIGVLGLAFSAGLETRTMTAGARFGGRLFASAVAALALPFIVGGALAYSGAADELFARPQDVDALLFAAAIGICLAVSALPVLVGIVRELPRSDRVTGNSALRIAVLDDAILWIGLAVLLFLHGHGNDGFLLDRRSAVAIGVFLAMALLRRFLDGFSPSNWAVAATIGAVYLAAGAWATNTLGLHELLGAYFAGTLAPAGVAVRLRPESIGKVALFGLSPFFFAHRGFGIDGSVVTWAAFGAALMLVALGMIAKLIALFLTPPEKNMPAGERLRLGLLLQCKGLMEIVAASILLQAGILSATAFAILVALAILSTTLTIPLFRMASHLLVRRASKEALER